MSRKITAAYWLLFIARATSFIKVYTDLVVELFLQKPHWF